MHFESEHAYVLTRTELSPVLQTVCTYWLKGLCMKGESCGFLHEWNPERMPVCRTLLKHGVCREPDCPYKHSLEEIKVTCPPLHLHADSMALGKPLH